MMLPKLDLNVTNKCNYRCVHCAFESGEWRLDEFSSTELEKILRETKELGGQRIDITGGEPVLREDIEELITIAKKLDYKVELVTNGSLLTRDRLLKLRKLGLDGIAVSLDGSDYETYSRIRCVGKDQYKRAVETVKNASDLGYYTKVNSLVCKSNYQDLPNISQFCIDNSVNEHGLYYFTPVGRGKQGREFAVEPLEWLDFIRKELIKFDSILKISTETPLIEKDLLEGKTIECIADNGRNHLHVLPDGKAYPCAILASYRKPLADLHEMSVKEVWQDQGLWDDYWKRIRKSFKEGYCVNFNAFDMSRYDLNKYKFVCPLRKFRLKELAYESDCVRRA